MTAVRRLRIQAGLTRQLLGQRVGLSQQTISWYETGSGSPTLRLLDRLARSVGLQVTVSFPPVVVDDPPLDRAVSVNRIESEMPVVADRSISAPGDLWTI